MNRFAGMLLAFFFATVLTSEADAAEKQRDWQTGKVLDSQRSRYFAGIVGHSNTTGTAQANGDYGTYQENTSTTRTAVYRTIEAFVIEGDTLVYLAQERLRTRWSKPANLTINGPVKFAVEKRKLYVIDEDGKEHEMEIVKKVLREKPDQPKVQQQPPAPRMQRPKLILDTSACSRIARSPHRRRIESQLDSGFRRVVSVHTFWELLHQIEGGDGSHFNDDREVIKVATGSARRPFFLPDPVSYAIETVLKLPRPTRLLPPRVFKQTYDLIIKARTRDELYQGVPVLPGLPYLRRFEPDIVRQQQEELELVHVMRLELAKRTKIPWLPPDAWARRVVKHILLISLDDEQAVQLGKSLDAAYQFNMKMWNAATAPKSKYNPTKHGNDQTDMQQTMYLCDAAIYLMTADRPLFKKVETSTQSSRVVYLPDYLAKNGLML